MSGGNGPYAAHIHVAGGSGVGCIGACFRRALRNTLSSSGRRLGTTLNHRNVARSRRGRLLIDYVRNSRIIGIGNSGYTGATTLSNVNMALGFASSGI